MDREKRLDPLDDFAADLQAAFVRSPADDVRERHLMAMKAVEPAPASAPIPRRRPRVLVRGAVAAAGLVLVGGSALAATGTLPDPLQNAVSKAASAVGIDVPPGHTKLPSNPKAAENKQAAIDFAAAQREWVACMKAARADDQATGEPTGAAEEACGAKPQPGDFRTPKAEKTDKPDKTTKPSKTPKDNPSVDRPSNAPADPSAKPEGAGKPEGVGNPEKTDNPNKGGPNTDEPADDSGDA